MTMTQVLTVLMRIEITSNLEQAPDASGEFLCQGIWSIYPFPVASSFAKVFWI